MEVVAGPIGVDVVADPIGFDEVVVADSIEWAVDIDLGPTGVERAAGSIATADGSLADSRRLDHANRAAD